MLSKNQKQRLILGSILTAFLVVFIVLCVAVSKKSTKIKTYKNELRRVELVVDSLERTNKLLSSQDCITVNCTFEITNKNIFSASNIVATQIAKEAASITRKEILDSLILRKN